MLSTLTTTESSEEFDRIITDL